MESHRPILFVNHSASRNGATILLLHFLRWLKNNSNYRFEILTLDNGPLRDEFEEIAPVLLWRSPGFMADVLPRRARTNSKAWIDHQSLNLLLRARRYELIFANTAAIGPHMPCLRSHGRQILWHLHELSYALNLSLGAEPTTSLQIADRFIAASDAVKDTLVTEFELAADKIDVVYEFILPLEVSEPQRGVIRNQTRAQLEIPEDAFVVGACGGVGWRKGTDLLLQTAHLMKKTEGARIYFLWIGAPPNTAEKLQVDHEVRALALEPIWRWIPVTEQMRDYYVSMDVFALPSREDPFPLVMLEAASLGLPVVCFKDSGGGPEFVGQDAGLVADYGSVSHFAEHLQTLRRDPATRLTLGAQGARKVRSKYAVEVQAPGLLRSIESVLTS